MNNTLQKIIAALSPADALIVLNAIKTANHANGVIGINLTPDEKDQIKNVKRERFPFINEVIGNFMLTNPEYISGYKGDAAFATMSFLGYNQQESFLTPANGLLDMILDTQNMYAYQCLQFALHYYDRVKEAAENNEVGAKAIYEKLKVYFEGMGVRPTPPDATPPA